MCKPLVSVVIPYYNREKVINRALDSVINQTYNNVEIILIDDGSTDKSHEIVETYIKNNNNFKFIHIYQDNNGPSKARNEGIKKANGKYIAFLDSDDSWARNKLQVQIEFMESNKDISILGTEYNLKNSTNPKDSNKEKVTFKEANFYTMLLKTFFITPTVVIRSEILKNDKNMSFDVHKKQAEDTLLYLKICRNHRGGKICIPLVTIYKSIYGEGGLSESIILTEKSELDNFKILYKENYKYDKKISFTYLTMIIIFSIMKFMRRVLIVNLRKIRVRNK